MRFAFSLIFLLLIFALAVCARVAVSSKKAIGRYVALLDAALIPPVLGNMLIVGSSRAVYAYIGYYIYFIGMDLVMYALLQFAAEYCKGTGDGQKIPKFIYACLGIDAVQLLLNTVTGHAFTTEQIIVEETAYFRLVPLVGQTFHRIVDYGILAAVCLIFCIVLKRISRVNSEKYSIVLVTMIVVALWETFYIFSRSPIDRSMIGFGVFGLLIFYFALYYRPLRLLDRMLSGIMAEMSDALYVFDPNGKCIWANEKGYCLADVSSDTLDQTTKHLLALFGNASVQDGQEEAERVIVINGVTRYFTLDEHQVRDEKQKPTGSYLRIRDVTEEKEKIKREMYNSIHDSLTDMYTREYLYTRIAERLHSDTETEYLILFLDIKNFKVVNDIFGSAFGDHALRCIADWSRSTFSENCLYGRLAGDTFGACIPKDEFDPAAVESRLASFVVKDEKAEYRLLLHLGVYDADRDDTDVAVMFDRAQLSLSTIRDEYNTHVAYYDDEIRERIVWNQKISAQLAGAIRERQLMPYLQPIADETGTIVGAEALVRWIHPEQGFLPPSAFIPIFEKNGMIVEVDRHMWRSACEVLAKWQKEGRSLFISVNISPKDFYFADVLQEIKDLVAEYGIDPASLRIEITETVMMDDAENRMQVLHDFREAGFIVEMDDFGSGYSSLNMLKDMPVDVLKIDMKFLGKTNDKAKARTIVRNIIRLSKDLGICALTEGVETQVQYQALAEMGCDLFQGYFFAKPMPLAEFEQML